LIECLVLEPARQPATFKMTTASADEPSVGMVSPESDVAPTKVHPK
jgi:hypothetical protein